MEFLSIHLVMGLLLSRLRSRPLRGAVEARLIVDEINKNELSEADISDLFITPAIKDAGWDPLRQIRRGAGPVPVFLTGKGSYSKGLICRLEWAA